MLAGVITPPIILAGQGGANLPEDQAQYLVSTSLIVCGEYKGIAMHAEILTLDRYSQLHSNYPLPHLQDTLLYWHRFDLCCRNFICNHSRRHWRSCPDVHYWLLSYRCQWQQTAVPSRLWCHHRNSRLLRASRSPHVIHSAKVSEEAFPASRHWSHCHVDWRLAHHQWLRGLGRRFWQLHGPPNHW